MNRSQIGPPVAEALHDLHRRAQLRQRLADWLASGVAGAAGAGTFFSFSDGGATDRAGAESRLRFYVNGNGSSSGRRRDDVARAEVCREDEAREAWGLGGVVFLSPTRR